MRFRFSYVVLLTLFVLAVVSGFIIYRDEIALLDKVRDGVRDRDRTALLGNVEILTVDMYDSYYGANDTNIEEPPVWTIPSGTDIVLNLVNHGLLNHNWAIIKQGATIPVPYEEGQAGDLILHGVGMVYNNSQTTTTFTAPASGEYQVICTVSGHYPFMQGKLRVVDGE